MVDTTLVLQIDVDTGNTTVNISYKITDNKCTVLVQILTFKTFQGHKHSSVNFSGVRIRVMMFNATFNNILAISWPSVLLVGKIGVPREKHRPGASH